MKSFKPYLRWSVRLIVMALGLFQNPLCAQEEAGKKEFRDMSLEELLDVKITVASKTNMTQRESPGIISVITQEEIINSGARDLGDVLLFVPGFMPALDVQNSIGIGIRGSWAHEGKVLLLVDGQEFNETLYSTLQIGNHFPLEQIKRIEIIRGPGSATYGGYAELGVINIITKAGADLNGVSAAMAYGQMADAYARRTLSLSFGKKWKDVDFAVHGFAGQGNRSDRDYTDVYGQTFNMKGNSNLDPMNLNVGFRFKGLSTRFILDRFDETTRDVYDYAISQAVENDFNAYLFEAKYDFKLGNKLSLSPRFNYTRHSPWQCASDACLEQGLYFGKTAERIKENLTLSYDPTARVNILAGEEFYDDRAHTPSDAPEYDLFQEGEHSIGYRNEALFAQGQIRTGWVDVTVGGRMEHHSQAGNSFAPRFALTKVKGKFHVKGLVSKAFRAPGIENLLLNPEVRPERTTVLEFEAGYQLTGDSILTGNVFNSRIKKPIVYSYNSETDQETYQNFSQAGTRGFELDYRIKKEWGYVNANYSYYRAIRNEVDYYSIEDHSDLLLGFPAHKLAATANLRLAKSLALNPSLVFISSRYGYITPLEGGAPEKFDPLYLANLNITWRNFPSRGLDLNFGVYDIFGQNLQYIQPYKGSHAPLPGPSREFRVRLGYHWNYSNE